MTQQIGQSVIARMSTTKIEEALKAGGYGALVGRAAEIKKAAKNGCLLWSSTRLTTTDASRIDARPAR